MRWTRRLGVEPICEVLQVAPSTYYAARERPPSRRARRDAELTPRLTEIWKDKLCLTAGFEPQIAASVNDLATAVGLVAVGWGITIAPELTPGNSDRPVAHVPLADISTMRHSVLIVREGEHLLLRIATAIAAVREVSARSWTNETPRLKIKIDEA